ncbi:MAG TPA: DUF3892 domain-containing protein [Actinocrinis sp.]|uniref:DUF3892 domain-containing protein n=1 Tax=Actinocrinis sp. TaxID=1920516 RepID=UPI002DDCAD37|nr:DUF3892 domain-containing protein [Actinocrinis sp.]HEV2345624.1 DUF3892 domain-containing protein [Actinocrinis sp.]
MSIQITRTELSGGSTHEHIVRLWWTNPSTNESGNNSRAEIVAWIENESGKAYTDDGRGHRADVLVRTSERGVKYLQTRADGVWGNNLLALAHTRR